MDEDVTAGALVLRHNERLKLLATALNNLALAFVGGGFIAPILRLAVPGDMTALQMFVWFALGIFLHGSGQWVLGRLQ
jgi:hypothetical protein